MKSNILIIDITKPASNLMKAYHFEKIQKNNSRIVFSSDWMEL